MNIVALFNALPGGCAQGLIWGIMAIGVFITYKILDLADLTVDGTMCTGGAVCVVMMMNGHSVGFSLFCAFVAGMLAGLVTGIFHTAMGIPAILAGILTQLFVVAVIIVVLIAILYWFFGTELGCSIRSTGSNENMSRAQGINTDLTKIIGLMLSNGIVALSSGLLTQYQGFADINMGRGAIVIGLAAVIIGEVVFGKISRNFNDLKLLSALVVAVFLAIPYMKRKYFSKPVKKGGARRA